uniref:Uncharacterized protein n=1 Tax=Romanomermis culicivorax TaxID=13658 RepID=A0A915K4Z4_ROMCU
MFSSSKSFDVRNRNSLVAIETNMLHLLSTIFLSILIMDAASAECCRVICQPIHVLGYCGDCTQGVPFCGHGKCNALGCNCEGGCRRGPCNDFEYCMQYRSIEIEKRAARQRGGSVARNGNGTSDPPE